MCDGQEGISFPLDCTCVIPGEKRSKQVCTPEILGESRSTGTINTIANSLKYFKKINVSRDMVG